MRMVIVAVRDIKSDNYARPWFVATEAAAIRAFADETNRQDRDNQLNTHPEDFQLYAIGLYDDADGKIYGKDVPKLLTSGDQCIERKIDRNHIHAV